MQKKLNHVLPNIWGSVCGRMWRSGAETGVCPHTSDLSPVTHAPPQGDTLSESQSAPHASSFE